VAGVQLTLLMRTVVTCSDAMPVLPVDVRGLLAGRGAGAAEPAACVPPGFAAQADGAWMGRTPSSSAASAALKNLDRPWAPVLAKITNTRFAPNGCPFVSGDSTRPISGI